MIAKLRNDGKAINDKELIRKCFTVYVHLHTNTYAEASTRFIESDFMIKNH